MYMCAHTYVCVNIYTFIGIDTFPVGTGLGEDDQFISVS